MVERTHSPGVEVVSSRGGISVENSGCCAPSYFRRPFARQGDATRCVVHAQCACTEKAALARRVYVRQEAWSRPMEKQFRSVVKDCKTEFRTWHTKTLELDEAVLQLSDSKRKRYLEAAKSLRERPWEPSDANIKMFVKADKLTGVLGEAKKPRAIQGRSPRHNLRFAQWMKPIEHALMVWKGRPRGVERTRVFAKGLNAKQRASLILRKCANFKNPLVISVDASSFDASVSVKHLRAMHELYRAMNSDPEFAELLQTQLHNKGVTQHGHKYEIDGNRMSGDVDTGIGNSILNYCIMAACMRAAGVKRWDLLCDGDDALLFMEDGDCDFAIVSDCARGLGFSLTGDAASITHENYYDIEFCRARPVWCPGGWILCRNPWRAVACFGCTHKFARVPFESYRRFLKGCAMCELHVSNELPMIGALAQEVYTRTRGKAILGDEERWRNSVRLNPTPSGVKPVKVHAITRAHIELGFGITVEEQRTYEASVKERVDSLSLPERKSIDAVIEPSQHYWLHLEDGTV
uniref:RNA-directed RNA polymerase n=1 Tax=Phytophthora palustris tombus-like virus 1 TaxID=2976301 RepID=A0A9E8YVU0_9TOMB|nr:RNA-dependent RNA polymerase [Phytophthora palustris tombus-like virus 1]